MTHTYIAAALLPLALLLTGCSGTAAEQDAATGITISGKIKAGLRILTLTPSVATQDFNIYRGDYITLSLPTDEPVALTLPALHATKSYPVAAGEKPYIKIPDAGTFAYAAQTATGPTTGSIHAIEYTAPRYREVSASEAKAMIVNIKPMILDVRTPGEFAGGCIEGAELIPVQVLAAQLVELGSYRRDPILLYCASGNRSTVAAKMLIDAGFEQVTNLRRGIAGWRQAGFQLSD